MQLDRDTLPLPWRGILAVSLCESESYTPTCAANSSKQRTSVQIRANKKLSSNGTAFFSAVPLAYFLPISSVENSGNQPANFFGLIRRFRNGVPERETSPRGRGSAALEVG
jgi:hypothetical protein